MAFAFRSSGMLRTLGWNLDVTPECRAEAGLEPPLAPTSNGFSLIRFSLQPPNGSLRSPRLGYEIRFHIAAGEFQEPNLLGNEFLPRYERRLIKRAS